MEQQNEVIFSILYAVQLKKVILSTDIQKTVQEYADPDLEFELLGQTKDPKVAEEKAREYFSKVAMHGSPHGNAFGSNTPTEIKLV